MKRHIRTLRHGAVVIAAAAALVTVAAGASSAGTRVTATPAQIKTVALHTASLAAHVRPNQINQWCQYTNAEPEIEFGSTGVAVQQAQCELNSVINGSHTIAEDGIFGQDTLRFTEEFQGCAGLARDGIIGPLTWAALDAWSAVARPCG